MANELVFAVADPYGVVLFTGSENDAIDFAIARTRGRVEIENSRTLHGRGTTTSDSLHVYGFDPAQGETATTRKCLACRTVPAEYRMHTDGPGIVCEDCFDRVGYPLEIGTRVVCPIDGDVGYVVRFSEDDDPNEPDIAVVRCPDGAECYAPIATLIGCVD